MKTTIEISDALFAQAREIARRDGLTLRALIESGLRRVVDERKPATRFRLRDASFTGDGVQAPFQEGSWDDVRAAIYEGRGG